MTEPPPIADAFQFPFLFQLMAGQIPGIVWATDTDLRFTASFGAGLAALGLHPSEVIGKTLFDYFQTANAAFPPIAAHARALLGEAVDFEQIWQDRIFRCHLEQLHDDNGSVIGCVGFAQDVTEQKQAEIALRASETKYRRLHESMMDAFVSVNMDGQIQEFNDAYRQMLGYQPEELSNLTYQDLTPSQWHRFEAEIVRDQILPRGYSDTYEKEYQRKNGTIFPVELRTFLIADDNGQPVAMWAIIRDITERKQAEAAQKQAHDELDQRVKDRTVELREINERLRAEVGQRRQAEEKLAIFRRFVETATQGFGMADADGRILYVNPFLAQLFGAQSPDDVIGKHVSAFYPADYLTRRDREIMPALHRREHWHGEQALAFPDRQMHPTLHTIFPVHDDNGELLCTAAVITDITELKRTEEELRQSEERYRTVLED